MWPMPDFVKGMNQLIADNDLDTVKTYLRWQTLHGACSDAAQGVCR